MAKTAILLPKTYAAEAVAAVYVGVSGALAVGDVVLDCHLVDGTDSEVIGLLVSICKRSKAADGFVTLINVGKDLFDLIDVFGLKSLVNICPKKKK